jgi:hypothetical protein
MAHTSTRGVRHHGLFAISYDQHRDRDYTPIWTLLRRWGAARVLESLWLANLNASAGTVRETIRQATRNEDSIVVIELKPGSEWSSYNAQAPGAAWLNQNLVRYQ